MDRCKILCWRRLSAMPWGNNGIIINLYLHILSMKFHCSLFFPVVAMLLQSCTTFGPAYKPHAPLAVDQSLLYIYWPGNTQGSPLSAVFKIDGGPVVAKIDPSGYAAIPLAPGTHTLVQTWKAGLMGNKDREGRPIARMFRTTAGAATYIRFATATDNRTFGDRGEMFVEWRMTPVDADVALPELASCRKASEPDPED